MKQQIIIGGSLAPEDVHAVEVFAQALILCRGVGGGTQLAQITVEAMCSAAAAAKGEPREVELVREYWSSKTPPATP